MSTSQHRHILEILETNTLLLLSMQGLFTTNSIFACLDVYASLGSHDAREDLTDWNKSAVVMVCDNCSPE